jgi:hypothetical protein
MRRVVCGLPAVNYYKLTLAPHLYGLVMLLCNAKMYLDIFSKLVIQLSYL